MIAVERTADPRSSLGWRRMAVLLAHAFVVWLGCATIMGVGMASGALETTLWIHLAAAPVLAMAVSYVYHRWFGYTRPVVTAVWVIGFVVVLDFVLVALVILQSLDMFRSAQGTWIPFGLIFGAIWLTGRWVRREERP